ncbi:hypothetical protein [Gemmatimonas sp.]|uniref:hypothetical protein n=1 Tax=Gemmatimonas sp. TaxID=1962908 RepID=UPI003562EAB7
MTAGQCVGTNNQQADRARGFRSTARRHNALSYHPSVFTRRHRQGDTVLVSISAAGFVAFMTVLQANARPII